MKHVRQQIREEITAKLQTIAGFADSVFPARVHPFNKDDLPAMVVRSEAEQIEKASQGNRPGIQKRYIETAVYVFTRTQDNIEDAIDDLARLVEQKIFEDPTLGGVAAETVLTGIDPAIGGEPDAPTGAHRMAFVSLVLTKEGIPQTAL